MLAPSGFKRSAAVSTPKVEIYTKWGCPFCVRAKALLDNKGVAYEEFDVTLGGPKKAEMQQRAPGAMTVPQIFVGDQALGGCDDIQALDRAGKLDPLLGL
jgi:glutaredoxin 3